MLCINLCRLKSRFHTRFLKATAYVLISPMLNFTQAQHTLISRVYPTILPTATQHIRLLSVTLARFQQALLFLLFSRSTSRLQHCFQLKCTLILRQIQLLASAPNACTMAWCKAAQYRALISLKMPIHRVLIVLRCIHLLIWDSGWLWLEFIKISILLQQVQAPMQIFTSLHLSQSVVTLIKTLTADSINLHFQLLGHLIRASSIFKEHQAMLNLQ